MNWQDRWETTMMRNYGVPPLLLVKGHGSRVWDDSDKEYIDLIGGMGYYTVVSMVLNVDRVPLPPDAVPLKKLA